MRVSLTLSRVTKVCLNVLMSASKFFQWIIGSGAERKEPKARLIVILPTTATTKHYLR